MRYWKKLIVVPALIVMVGAPPAMAVDQEQLGREPTTNEVIGDALIVRPFGLFATVIGAAAFVVSLPFTLPSGTTDRAAEAMVAKPARDTFKKPIGQLDSCETLPESCR